MIFFITADLKVNFSDSKNIYFLYFIFFFFFWEGGELTGESNFVLTLGIKNN